LGKLFVEALDVSLNIADFAFYICIQCDKKGCHFIGYFSRRVTDGAEAEAGAEAEILSCVLVLPPFQRQGYGRLLVSVAYEMARREGCGGGPGPLLRVGLGARLLKSYWADAVLNALHRFGREVKSVEGLAMLTSIANADVAQTLVALELVVPSARSPGRARFNFARVAALVEERSKKKRMLVIPTALYFVTPLMEALSAAAQK
jgi:GNAT superfamily N-acetyltransferase